jgi:hypothetical protein
VQVAQAGNVHQAMLVLVLHHHLQRLATSHQHQEALQYLAQSPHQVADKVVSITAVLAVTVGRVVEAVRKMVLVELQPQREVTTLDLLVELLPAAVELAAVERVMLVFLEDLEKAATDINLQLQVQILITQVVEVVALRMVQPVRLVG